MGGKPVRVFLCHRPVSSIHPSNELMRRCLLRWEYETPRRAFCRIWQRFLRGSFKDRILLVNLLQSSRSPFSRGSFLSFFVFKDGMWVTSISVLGGWPTVSDRFSRHLTTHCGIKCNSLAPKIVRLLPGSDTLCVVPGFVGALDAAGIFSALSPQACGTAGSTARSSAAIVALRTREAGVEFPVLVRHTVNLFPHWWNGNYGEVCFFTESTLLPGS